MNRAEKTAPTGPSEPSGRRRFMAALGLLAVLPWLPWLSRLSASGTGSRRAPPARHPPREQPLSAADLHAPHDLAG